MLKEIGKVVAAEGRTARVVLAEHEGCAGCEARRLCRMGSEGTREVEADNEIGVQVGDVVVVAIKTSYALGAAVVLFGIPVLLGLAGVIIGSKSGNSVLAAGLGLAGVSVGLVAAKLVDRNWSKTRRSQPKIVEIKVGESEFRSTKSETIPKS